MTSMIKDGILFSYCDNTPSPHKGYSELLSDQDEVIFRFWKISLRKNGTSLPFEKRESLDDFLYDERIQSEIQRLFGSNLLVYVRGLASGHIDYLVRLPQHLLIHIIRFLELEDTSRLAQTCKMFSQLCNGNELWELIFKDHTKQKISAELHSLAMAIGWRKLFFTNKIQLQVRLTRQTAKTKEMRRQREAVKISKQDPPPQPPAPAGAATVGEGSNSSNPEEEAAEDVPEPEPISPYPEGETKPQFKKGPEDYANYTLFDPRDLARMMIEGPPEEEDEEEDEVLPQVTDEEEEAARRKQKAFEEITFDDWGEDFSFLC